MQNITSLPTNSSVPFNIYGYVPNKPAAVVVCLLFLAEAITVLVLMLIRCRRFFMLAAVIGALAEAAGYALRVPSSEHPTERGLAIGTILPILLAPIVIALTAYWCLGFIVRRLGRKSSLFPPACIEWAFVISDVLSFFIQAAGGASLTSSSTAAQKLGKTLLIIGLSFSLASFTVFLASVGFVHCRSCGERGKWRRLFFALYINGVCLIVRSSYRLLEYISGYRTGFFRKELWFYLLDAVPMLLAVGSWIVWPPSFYSIEKGSD